MGYYKKTPSVRCHVSHKELEFGKGILLGASCGSPRPGYDIYIGFDYGMTFEHQGFPWEVSEDTVIEFQYHITDMEAPKSPKQFKKMITWVCSQLHEGKRIHAGCIGGHGRTGLFLAAVRAEFDGDLDAGNWVRKNHCQKAIESKSQIKFLFKHYGIKKIKPSKKEYKGWVEGSLSSKVSASYNSNGTTVGQKVVPIRGTKPEKMKYVMGKGSIWG